MLRLFTAVSSLLFVVAVGAGLWSWLGRPVALVDVPGGRLGCLSYTPYDGSSSPLDGPAFHASTAGIRADLEQLRSVTGCIRTYSALEPSASAVPIAAELGLTVWQGLWIGPVEQDNEKEIKAAVALAKAYPGTIDRFVVGNEVLLRRELLGEQLAAVIRKVKTLVPGIPTTYADVPEFWRRNPVLAEAADIVTIHILPYWDDPLPMTMAEVQGNSRILVEEMQARYPDRPVAIGEIGWPSAGRTRGGVVPSIVNEAKFVREFVAQTEAIGVEYNIVEAIDQDWKIWPEGTVGGHWGILDHQRQEKFPLTGPVSEWPQWPLALLLSSLGAVAAVAAGLLWRAPTTPWRWLGLAALGQVTGTAAVMAVRYIGDVSFGWPVWTLNSVMLTVSVLCLAAVAPLVIGGQAVVRAASIRQVVSWLRRPRQTLFHAAIGYGVLFGVPLLWAGQLAVLHAFDGRHRDFPLVILLPVAAAQAVRWWHQAGTAEDTGDRREEAWLAIIFIVCGALAWDGPNNVEAMTWMGTLALFALPWLGEARSELMRLVRR